MTCLERLKMERPVMLDPNEPGGAKGCPWMYDYADQPPQCGPGHCDECWNREVAQKLGIPTDDIFEEELCDGTHPQWPKDNPHISDTAKKAAEEHRARILDSGNRTEFATGAVRDMREGKGRCDLMPLEVVSQVLGVGMIYDLKLFLASGNTTYLYACLQEFSTVYDDGKTKASAKAICDQRYCTMFLEVAKHFEEGAKKYGENNWQKGIPVHCYIDSAIRHYLKWLRGDKDEPHDRAFVWNLMCCIWEVDYREEKTV